MFVKKDKRKITEILTDPTDNRSSLLLARRALEFERDTRVLFSGDQAPLASVTLLSLYNSKLTRLSGFSSLVSAGSPLESLVLGANELTTLPNSLAGVRDTLARLWIEDNALTGALPPPLLACTRLRVLRLSQNLLTSADGIGALKMLEELALDSNTLTTLPAEIGELTALRTLQIRGNMLTELPEELGDCLSLESLYASSNRLSALPRSLGRCLKLKLLQVNGNAALVTLPVELAEATSLQRVVAANCGITALPLRLVTAWAHALPTNVVASAALLIATATATGKLDGPDIDFTEWNNLCATRSNADIDYEEHTVSETDKQLQHVLREASVQDALFFEPFVCGDATTSASTQPPPSPPLYVDISGNAINIAANVATTRRSTAREELRIALVDSTTITTASDGTTRTSSPLLSVSHGAQLIVATVALHAARVAGI